MKLNVLERLMVLQILPKESNFVTLGIVFDLQKELTLTEEEIKEFEVVMVPDKGANWNEKGKEEREIKIGEKAADIIVEALKKINAEKKITPQLMSLYEKFVEVK